MIHNSSVAAALQLPRYVRTLVLRRYEEVAESNVARLLANCDYCAVSDISRFCAERG